MNTHAKALEFDKIIQKLQEHAISQQGKDKLAMLTPFMDEKQCVHKMEETTAARNMLDSLGSPPLPTMKGMDELLLLADAGAMLVPGQLEEVGRFAAGCKRMISYLGGGEGIESPLARYRGTMDDLSALRQEIENCIHNEEIRDDASASLRSLRRKVGHAEGQIKEKLNHILQSRKQYLADSYIAQRNGHYVLPVQRQFKNQFGGVVIESSAKGNTLFMEPNAVSKLQEELTVLQVEEDAEQRRILYTLSAMVAEQGVWIRRNMECIEVLDILFAKGKLSAAMHAGPVEIGGRRRMEIRQGRHPLLDPQSCVPLDFCLEEGSAGVIITGPNTGGKTVAIKTVGLLTLMAQSGLHVPCREGSYIAMQDACWCDIGDSQDLSQNLSTFSGHMTNVISILEKASSDSLVILDELGSGTDPAEGMGIAVAVLEELRQRGCMFLVTTHYPQVKTYAEETEGVKTARMAFDKDSLSPLYILEMDLAGESCALHIAKRLGLAQHLIDRAHREVYGEKAGENSGGQERIRAMPRPGSRLKRILPEKQVADVAGKFTMGDSVILLPGTELGIVYRPADDQGDVIVQVKGEKRRIKHNRLQLKLSADELYPPDYDFSILFDSVDDRKARKKMGKRHDPSSFVYTEKEELANS